MKIKCRRKAFTLLETIAYLSISLILVFIEMSIFIGMNSNFYSTLSEAKELNRVSMTLANLNKIIALNSKSEKIKEEDKLLLKEVIDENTSYIREIYKDKDKLVIDYKANYSSSVEKLGRNVILQDVEDFKVIEKERVIYLQIKYKGQEYIECI